MPWVEGQASCNFCKFPLIKKGDFHWCIRCEDWRYPEVYQHERHGKSKIEYFPGGMSTTKMREKMDIYLEKFSKKQEAEAKFYYSSIHDKTVLESLISKR